MVAPTYATILLTTQKEMDAISRLFIFNGYQALVSHLSKPLGLLCILYIVLMGYGMLSGYIKTPLDAFKKIVFRIGFIYTFAMNWGVFSHYFIGLFIDSASEIGSLMMQASSLNVPVTTGSGINGALQSVFIEIIRVGQWVFDKASVRHWAPAFTGIMIDLCGIITVGLAFFEWVLAKLMLALLLAMAPLFILLTLFDSTRTFFDRWLGTVVGFSLLLIFVSTVIGLCLHLLHVTISPHYVTQGDNVTFSDWIPIALMAVFSIMALLEVTSIAKSIGGACSTANGSALMGGFIGSALDASRSAKSLAVGSQQTVSRSIHAMKRATTAGHAASTMQGIQQRLRGER